MFINVLLETKHIFDVCTFWNMCVCYFKFHVNACYWLTYCQSVKRSKRFSYKYWLEFWKFLLNDFTNNVDWWTLCMCIFQSTNKSRDSASSAVSVPLIIKLLGKDVIFLEEISLMFKSNGIVDAGTWMCQLRKNVVSHVSIIKSLYIYALFSHIFSISLFSS